MKSISKRLLPALPVILPSPTIIMPAIVIYSMIPIAVGDPTMRKLTLVAPALETTIVAMLT
jgi:hypothetical protein